MNEQSSHIVRSYDQEQAALLDELIRMGQMSAAQLEAALDVVERRDGNAAERVIANDEAIDALEQQVNHDVIYLIRRGPLATDLRIILAALRVASDIERIGDYAANIAKRSLALNLSPPLPHTRGLNALGKLAVQQVRDVLEAYRHRDGEAALRVRARDAELDTLYTGLFRELLTYMNSRCDHPVHAPAVHGQEPGTDRRPRHQHRREHLVPAARPDPAAGAREAR